MEDNTFVEKTFVRRIGRIAVKAAAGTAVVVGGILLVSRMRKNDENVAPTV